MALISRQMKYMSSIYKPMSFVVPVSKVCLCKPAWSRYYLNYNISMVMIRFEYTLGGFISRRHFALHMQIDDDGTARDLPRLLNRY